MYNAVLGLVDITRGTNSFYKLQLLESDSGKSYYLFRAWGRVGTTIGGNKLEASLYTALYLIMRPWTIVQVVFHQNMAKREFFIFIIFF